MNKYVFETTEWLEKKVAVLAETKEEAEQKLHNEEYETISEDTENKCGWHLESVIPV